MCSKHGNKYFMLATTIIVFLLGFVAVAPLRESSTTAHDASSFYNIIGAGCRGDETICDMAATHACPDGTTAKKGVAHVLYSYVWLGGTDPCGNEELGMKEVCETAKKLQGDAAWDAELNSTRLGCEQTQALFVASVMWALGMAACGCAAVVAILSVCVFRCECMKGCAQKMFRIIIGVLMFLAGIFLSAAVGLFDHKGIRKTQKCEYEDAALGLVKDRDGCFKQAPGFYAYIILVVLVAWASTISAFSAACCCDPDDASSDEAEDAVAHPAAPKSVEMAN